MRSSLIILSSEILSFTLKASLLKSPLSSVFNISHESQPVACCIALQEVWVLTDNRPQDYFIFIKCSNFGFLIQYLWEELLCLRILNNKYIMSDFMLRLKSQSLEFGPKQKSKAILIRWILCESWIYNCAKRFTIKTAFASKPAPLDHFTCPYKLLV